MRDRRSFLKAAGGATLYLALPGRETAAQAPAPKDVLWVHIQAEGGWDPALFCDPRPRLRGDWIAKQVAYFDQSVRTVKTPGGGGQAITYLGFADFEAPADQGFFARYGADLLVINGVDSRTVDHTLGARYFASGSTNDDFPSFAATIAYAYGRTRPMALMDMGGYSASPPDLAPARLGGSAAAAWLARFANPNLIEGGAQPSRPETLRLLRAAQAERLGRLHDRARLVDTRAGVAKLRELRGAQEQFGKLDFSQAGKDYRTPDMVFVQRAAVGSLVPMGQEYRYPEIASERRLQFEIAFEAFRKGVGSSMVLSSPGFDSHSENEQAQASALRRVLGLASYAHSRATALGIPIAILLTSDFGRSVARQGSGDSGTGHWPVGSVMLLVNDAAKRILRPRTGVVVGGTTDELHARKVHPRTLETDPMMGGVVLSPGHVLNAMRALAGIDQDGISKRYELRVDATPDIKAG